MQGLTPGDGRGLGRGSGSRGSLGDRGASSGGSGGRGRLKGGGMGAAGICVCVKCGQRLPHRPGEPCMDQRCPECGAALVREGSEHHRKIEARTEGAGDESG